MMVKLSLSLVGKITPAFRRTGRPVAKADLAGGSFFRLPQSDKRVLR